MRALQTSYLTSYSFSIDICTSVVQATPAQRGGDLAVFQAKQEAVEAPVPATKDILYNDANLLTILY